MVLGRWFRASKVFCDGADMADSLSGCFFDAVEDEWSMNMEPILDRPHGLGFQMVQCRVQEYISVAVAC